MGQDHRWTEIGTQGRGEIEHLGNPFDLGGHELSLFEGLAEGDDAVIGQQDRLAAGLAVEGAKRLFPEIGRARRTVIGHQDLLRVGSDVLVHDERQVDASDRERSSMTRVGMYDRAEVGIRSIEREVQGDFARRTKAVGPRPRSRIDDGDVVDRQCSVDDTGRSNNEVVLVDPFAHVARRSDDESPRHE